MKRLKIKSSTIKYLEYYPELGLLEVEFVRGAIYTYFDVPNEVFSELIQAKSVGSYFNKNISKKYAFDKKEIQEEKE